MTKKSHAYPLVLSFGASVLLAAGTFLASALPAGAQEAQIDQGAGTPLLFTVPVAPPPVRPSSPSAAPPPALPDIYSAPVGPFAMYTEVIASGPSDYGLDVGPVSCVQSGVFRRGMKMVWRFEVYDLSNGVRLNDRDGSEATILLPDGTAFPAHFSKRGGPAAPPDNPWMWAGAWSIPPDYTLGPLSYSVQVHSADGRTAVLLPPVISSTWPQIVD